VRKIFLPVFLLYLFLINCCSHVEDRQANKGNDKTPLPSIEVKAEVDRTTAAISEPITFTLSALYKPGIKVKLPEPGSTIAGLRVIDFGEKLRDEADNLINNKKWYKLQADIEGTYIIPSMDVSYMDNGTTEQKLKTPQIFLKIKSALPESEKNALKDIIEIKPLQKADRNLTPLIIIGITVLIAITGIMCVFLYFKKKKNKNEIQKPAHVIALEALENLQKERLIDKGVAREHYFKLSDIFRRYIENRFGIPAVERTSQELIPEIFKLDEFRETVRSNTKEFLFHSDMVKFAKHSPSREEVDKDHNEILTVINETKEEDENQQPLYNHKTKKIN
jgi:hypothetical protein